MNKTLLAIFCLLLLPLASCADKMTDRHSEMVGGGQGVTNIHEVTPANSDGMGKPIAGGKINTTPDSMWNQASPLEAKPF
ncbi:MAG: hypothetical protein Q8922_05510 [Bacteroidota bacterium]|nr:hypothetical protein [Bacteroidota bacterium]MDP4233140.1 hypothetical protein [Bacteroidota bacterium]MDP4241715.1 hypothetical protein [Bacteroidota bacterium]MDP4287373.1 hypothetical protein [Bacteroidota bacterium]